MPPTAIAKDHGPEWRKSAPSASPVNLGRSPAVGALKTSARPAIQEPTRETTNKPAKKALNASMTIVQSMRSNGMPLTGRRSAQRGGHQEATLLGAPVE